MFLFLTGGTRAATAIPSQAWSRDINAGGYVDGAPIGGFGAGTLSWTYAGNFYQGRLNIASSTLTTDANCHFYMYQKLSGQAAVMKMLNAATLGSNQATYYSLFPKAWVDYSGSTFPLETKVTQFSPIIPNDYVRSSYPEGIYEWDVTNSQGVTCDFAVMLTFDNNFGGTSASVTTSGNNVGLVLDRAAGSATNQNQGQFTLATQTGAGVSVTYQSAAAVGTLQTAFGTAGLLANTTGANTIGGIAFKVSLAPGQSVKIPIVLAWDIPLAKPGTGALWYREYTRTYGKTGKSSGTIAFDALNNYPTWETSIDGWQNGILAGNYPDWMKQMLFNELYYYFTGGTIWEAGQYGSTSYDPGPDLFSSLESYIYPFYGTSDVRFYGSWPLALLWPDIDKQEVKQFCDSVVAGSMGVPMPTAIGTCAHDIGSLNDVFTAWNDYTYRDSTTWKDLNSKLVLMVYRAWELGGKTDSTFLNYCWPAVQAAMTKVHSQCDATGLPISSGIDQTYDDLGLTGDTAYCGSLFLAACEAAADMATAKGNGALATTYNGWLTTGKTNFESLLWDSAGGYYHIDTGSSAPSRIMSDQLAGQWYARALGLPGIVTDAHAVSAWQKVHDNNWQKFDSGAHGVVNVMTSAGAIDTSYPQSQEAWVGVGWGAAAGMVQQGMLTQATDMGYSLYNSIWNLGQWWFRTPEAWQTGLSNMRAPYYMRANCLWAVKHAYDIAPNPCGALTCTPTPTYTATATPQPASACASPVRRVNASGGQYVSGGITWVADQAYSAGGWGSVSGTAAASITSAISGTSYPGLYQTERYGNPVEYKFTVPNGSYQVVLHFVEQYWNAANSRVFSVAINGNTVLSNLDIYTQVGKFAAYDRTFVVTVGTGLIDIVETASVDNAEIAGIDILDNSVLCSPTPTPTGSTPTFTRTYSPSPTNSPTASLTSTPTATASRTATTTLTNSPTATFSSTPSSSPTASRTSTPTSTLSPSSTPSSTPSPSPTASPSLTPTRTATVTATPTNTNAITPTPTASPTVTASSTASSTPTLSYTPTPTSSRTPTPSLTPSSTATATLTMSPTDSATTTATRTATSTATVSPTPTNTNVITPTPTASPTNSPTRTWSPTASSTPTRTATASWTASFTLTPSPTPTATLTKTWSPSATPSGTPTPTGTPTASRTPTWTDTPIPSPTETSSPTVVFSGIDIGSPFPNPDQDGSAMDIEVQGPGLLNVHWSVFTTAFRKVRDGNAMIYGKGDVYWDLKDRSGVPVAKGLYYLRVEAGSGTGAAKKTFKVLLLH
ncbi:MAG TPA: GH116 family glycosyl hydrolase [bacterium]|nr:GH116 family glycosyl hydrolase [bacterium]